MALISSLLSLPVMIFDIGAEVTFELIFLVIASFGLSKINVRLTCLSYVVSFVYLVDLVITLLGIKNFYFDLPYEKLILLTGTMHVIEGVMAYFYGYVDNTCVVNYKDNQILGGYKSYRRWYIPLFLFKVKGIYLPLLCVMAYCDETYTMIPKKKTHRNAIMVAIYGLVVIYMGILVLSQRMLIVIAMTIMPLAHELLFIIDEYLEKEPYMYSIPKKGVRIIEVSSKQESVNKIERGDIMLRVNGKNILNEDSYYRAIDDKKLVMILRDISGNKKILYFDKKSYEELEVVILPSI